MLCVWLPPANRKKEIQATVKTSDLSSVKMIIIYSRKGITAALNDISVRQARQVNRPLLSVCYTNHIPSFTDKV